MEILSILSLFVSCAVLILLLIFFLQFRKKKEEESPASSAKDITFLKSQFDAMDSLLKNQLDAIQRLLSSWTSAFEKSQEQAQKQMAESLHLRLENMNKILADGLSGVKSSLQEMRESNEKKLGEIRNVVDEKLQKALDERLAQSFQSVVGQLKDVYKAVGEMTRIGEDVSSLKKVLTNVKTKGILGETQLANILEEILVPGQYERNIVTKKGSRDPVEFAIALPGKGKEPVYVPVDSKFPLAPYERLEEALEAGDKEGADSARKELKRSVLLFAKDIADKYIDVPHTTEFAVLFLPVESLYSEVLKMGLLEELQRQHHVVIAGPSTMCAFLNALSVGFKTLAIEKKTNEVHALLGKVKQEFSKFSQTLSDALTNLDRTRDKLENLIGARTRKIEASLRSIALPEEERMPELGQDVPLE